ncbi:MAG: hypothetical protein ABL903_08635 [Methylococcales bacterium]
MGINNFEYDNNGRIRFNPDIHVNHNKPWTTTDQKYLIENYDSLGPEEISFALGRTPHTIMERIYYLRKNGLPKPDTRAWHRRMKNKDTHHV